MRQPYRKSANPFYALLVAAGIAFVVTAAAYCVMAYRAREAVVTADATEGEHPLMIWTSQHGTTALLTELGILAVCTFAAIGTDEFWQRRAVKRD